MILISESVTLLFYRVVCDVIVINKNIMILPYLRVSCLFKGNLWHEHDECKRQSIARKGRGMFPTV